MNFGLHVDWAAPVQYSSVRYWAFGYHYSDLSRYYTGSVTVLGLTIQVMFDPGV